MFLKMNLGYLKKSFITKYEIISDKINIYITNFIIVFFDYKGFTIDEFN